MGLGEVTPHFHVVQIDTHADADPLLSLHKAITCHQWSQVPSSVWLDVATKEIVEDIDYTELEKLFSAETQETKTPNIGMTRV